MKHTYTVIAYNKMNSELIRIERPSGRAAIRTAVYWKAKGAAWCKVIDEDFDLYYVTEIELGAN